MIRLHEFNAAWWGAPVGIITDSNFFKLPPAEQRAALASYAWVEFKSALESAPSVRELLRAGFEQIDTQIHFHLDLSRIRAAHSRDELEVCFADEHPFTIHAHEPAAFVHERFMQLPGMTQQLLARRYALWAGKLVAHHPHWCMQVFYHTRLQGWFLSQMRESRLNLSLAMLHRDATISGMYLYQKAMIAYAQRGARLGYASFSVRNVAVHRLYAAMGAVFVKPEGCWIWMREQKPDESSSL